MVQTTLHETPPFPMSFLFAAATTPPVQAIRRRTQGPSTQAARFVLDPQPDPADPVLNSIWSKSRPHAPNTSLHATRTRCSEPDPYEMDWVQLASSGPFEQQGMIAKNFVCVMCELEFATKMALELHTRAKHS